MLYLTVRTVETHRAHIQRKARRSLGRSSCATPSSTASSSLESAGPRSRGLRAGHSPSAWLAWGAIALRAGP
jgi:hypothetical protein